MGLQTGSTSQQGTTTPGAAGQVQGALNTAGGLGGFAAPSSLYTLTPAEQTFQNMGMGLSLPGATAARALNYVTPGSPAGDMFQKYFQDFTAPTMSNNLLKSGYVGQSGANTQALANAGENAAMQGLTSFGAPMAQGDIANNATGMGYAGLQRQSSLQDFGRIQNLLTSLLPMLGVSSTGATQTQGPGLAASLLNLLGGVGGSLFNGGLLGSAGSLGAQLLGSAGSGLASLGSSAWNGLSSLFSGNPATDPATASNFFSGTAPDAVAPLLTDSGAMAGLPSQADQLQALLADSGGAGWF